MKHRLIGLCTSLALAGAASAQSADPATTPAPASTPGTHVESTIVGDARSDNAATGTSDAISDNDHHFEAGAPRLTEMAKSLNLSARQKSQLSDIIERGDAGAEVLIKREKDVQEMLEKTPPQDPRYAELRKEQSDSAARWQAARESVHQEILAVLTPTQQEKFEQMRSDRQAASRQ